jgi:hypothetical protein
VFSHEKRTHTAFRITFQNRFVVFVRRTRDTPTLVARAATSPTHDAALKACV